MQKQINPYLLFLTISAIVAGFFIVGILPTFDDWTTLSMPNYDKDWIPYFLPYGAVWRPGDALFGYINALDYHLYPMLNHIVVVAGHLFSCFLIYYILEALSFTETHKRLAVTFFFLCPCVLGTVLSVDGLNQTYSQLWGLAAIAAYLRLKGKPQMLCWALFTLLSAWAKDNGIAWAVVPPMLAFSFGIIDRKTLIRHFAVGIAFAVVYGAVRLSLPKTVIYNPDYYEFSIARHLKGIAIWLGYTWIPTDYVYIFGNTRNLIVPALTFIIGAPFVFLLFFNPAIKHKTFWGIVACAIVVISPNLLISLTVMNAYASLGMASVLVAYLYQQSSIQRWLKPLFIAYLASALFIDVHHYISAYQTALTGKEMAIETLRQTKHPVQKVKVLIFEDEYKKFSNFCVPPNEAYGWGRAVLQETAYQWPKEIDDTTLMRNQAGTIRQMAQEAIKNGYQSVWIVDNKQIKVINR